MRMPRFIIAMLFVTAAVLMYTHQRIEAVTLSYQISAKRVYCDKLLDRKRELEYNVCRLKTPTHLERQLAKEDVRLVLPERRQVFEAPGLDSGAAARPLPLIVLGIQDFFSLKSEAEATPAVR